MCDLLQVFEDLVLQTQAFGGFDDQLKGFAELVNLCHLSQAGWSQSVAFYSPLEDF